MNQNKYAHEIDRLKEAYRERDQNNEFWGYKSWGMLDPIVEFSEFQYKKSLLHALRAQNISYEQMQSLQVLEIGCGWGRNLHFFSEIGVPCSNLTGIDIIEHNLQLARKINPLIQYINGNAVEYNFNEKKFDIIIAHTVFSSILEPELHQKIIEVAINLLSHQGLFLIYDILPEYKTSATESRDGKPLEYIRGVHPEKLIAQFLDKKSLIIHIERMGLTPRWRSFIFVGFFQLLLKKLNSLIKKIIPKINYTKVPYRHISNCRFYLANICSLFKPFNGYFVITVRKGEKQ